MKMSAVLKKLNSKKSHRRGIDRSFGNVNSEYLDEATLTSAMEVMEKKLTKICTIHKEIKSENQVTF